VSDCERSSSKFLMFRKTRTEADHPSRVPRQSGRESGELALCSSASNAEVLQRERAFACIQRSIAGKARDQFGWRWGGLNPNYSIFCFTVTADKSCCVLHEECDAFRYSRSLMRRCRPPQFIDLCPNRKNSKDHKQNHFQVHDALRIPRSFREKKKGPGESRAKS
jgi:hypothetical protein